MIRRANLDDAHQIKQLCLALLNETDLGVEVDYQNIGDAVVNYLQRSDMIILVDEFEGVLTGISSITIEQSYYKRPIVNLYMFYVDQLYRNSDIGRLLLEATLDVVEELEPSVLYIGASSGLRTDKKLMNMYRKYGFEEVGFYFRRVF